MQDIIDDILNYFGIVSADSKQLFRDKSILKEIPKNTDIFIEGRKNDFEYFLISGLAHRYNISDKGDLVTTGFYISKSVITPHFARTNLGKSIFSLQTLTDSVIVEISVRQFDSLRHNFQGFQKFGQQIIETELARTFFTEVVFRSYNARERLLTMRKQYPNIENLIPHNIIASYLGITNVSLSRLRNKLAR